MAHINMQAIYLINSTTTTSADLGRWIFFHLEKKKVAECCYGALLQHNMYVSGINPTHRIRVRLIVKMQARSRGTIPKGTVPNGTVPLKCSTKI